MAQDNSQTTTQAPPQPGGGAPDAQERNGNGQPPQTSNGNGNGNGNEANAGGAPSFMRSALFKVIALVVIVIAAIWGFSYYKYSQNHVGTDDAYIAGDLINVSPIISGTLAKLNVDEGDKVKAGEVIAVLDKSGPLANYDAAKAAYQAAESQIPQAVTSQQYEQLDVAASIGQAQAALNAQMAKTRQAQQQVTLESQTTQAAVAQAQAQASASLAQAQTAEAQAASALDAVQTARSAAAAARQQITVANAGYIRAQRDANRYAALYGPQGSVAAVTAQQLDQAVATATSAHAQLLAAQDQAAQAQSQVTQATSAVTAAQAAARAAMRQYDAALTQVRIAQANEIQVPVQRFNVVNNTAITAQNAAQLRAAQAGQSQVQLRKQQVLTAQAQAAQAKAAMDNARVTLDDCTITAPTNGTVVRKGANIGDALSPGQTIVTMTLGNYAWVTANYKETQLQYVRPGEPVNIDVDAFPGKDFHGVVESINAASGNTTSLLPADNATGNFTKVVQRIPVKIRLVVPAHPGPNDATQQDIDNLPQGASCEPTIDVSSARQGH